MKITTLIENSLGDKNHLCNEHGLSMFIETSNYNILFDTGQSGDFIENAKKLNVDLEKTNILVLSHAHYDHCGGVKKLFNTFNISPKIYISEHFFNNTEKYHHSNGDTKLDFSDDKGGYKYIGIDFNKDFLEDKKLDINYIKSDIQKICPSVYLFTNFNRTSELEKSNPNMLIKKGDSYILDDFKEEVALGIDTPNGILILVGCSHPGIMNIVNTIHQRTDKKVYGVLGGTHLIEADETRIKATIDYFKSLDIELIGVSHCTGEKSIEMFSKEFNNFFVNATGTVLEI